MQHTPAMITLAQPIVASTVGSVNDAADSVQNYGGISPNPQTVDTKDSVNGEIFSMARIARLVLPSIQHHVTQGGNRRQAVFFGNGDYALCLNPLAARLRMAEVRTCVRCLMPNYVLLILCPSAPEGSRRAEGETHRRYCSVVNAGLRVTGHLFRSRYVSVAMDEEHLIAAARHVALNPALGSAHPFRRRLGRWCGCSAQ